MLGLMVLMYSGAWAEGDDGFNYGVGSGNAGGRGAEGRPTYPNGGGW
jgi:hypothetical protein